MESFSIIYINKLYIDFLNILHNNAKISISYVITMPNPWQLHIFTRPIFVPYHVIPPFLLHTKTQKINYCYCTNYSHSFEIFILLIRYTQELSPINTIRLCIFYFLSCNFNVWNIHLHWITIKQSKSTWRQKTWNV